MPKTASAWRSKFFLVFFVGGVLLGLVAGILVSLFGGKTSTDKRDQTYILTTVLGAVVGAAAGALYWGYYSHREHVELEEARYHKIRQDQPVKVSKSEKNVKKPKTGKLKPLNLIETARNPIPTEQ